MRASRVLLVALPIVTLIADAKEAQANPCINPHPVVRQNHTSARAQIAGAPPQYVLDGIEQGMSQWNYATCNEGGNDFPKFTTSTPTEANFTIHYHAGIGTACGIYDHSSRIIDLYNRRTIGSVVVWCPGHDPSLTNGQRVSLLGDTMAHELGHYLGLLHPSGSNCSNFIMSPAQLNNGQWSSNRSVQQAECDAADLQSTTLHEICAEESCPTFGGSGEPFHDDPGDGNGTSGGGGASGPCYWWCVDPPNGSLSCTLICS